MKIVYIDILFVTNLIPDYLLLRLSSVLLGRYPKRWRVALGAVFAALCSIPLYFLSLEIYLSLALKAAVCATVCLVVFGRQKLTSSCTVFTAMSFAFAGTVSALCWMGVLGGVSVQGTSFYANLSLPMLIAASALAYCLIRLIFGHGDVQKGNQCAEVCVKRGGKSSVFKAFYDSGNSLREPFCGKPIIIISHNSCRQLFSKEELYILDTCKDPTLRFSSLSKLGSGFSLIPYQTAGNNGLMLTFKPDELKTNGKNEDKLLGLSIEEISAGVGCCAIMGV